MLKPLSASSYFTNISICKALVLKATWLKHTAASELRGMKSCSARLPSIGTDEKEAPGVGARLLNVGVNLMFGSTKSRRRRGVPNARLTRAR